MLIHVYSPPWIEVFFLPGLLMDYTEHSSFLPFTCLAGRCLAQDPAAFVKSWDEGWEGTQGAVSTGLKSGLLQAGPDRAGGFSEHRVCANPAQALGRINCATPRPTEGPGAERQPGVGLSRAPRGSPRVQGPHCVHTGPVGLERGSCPLPPPKDHVWPRSPRRQPGQAEDSGAEGQRQKQAVLRGAASSRHVGGPHVVSTFRQRVPTASPDFSASCMRAAVTVMAGVPTACTPGPAHMV